MAGPSTFRAEQLGLRRDAEPVLFAEHAFDALRPRLRREPLRVRRLFDRPHARRRPRLGLGNMQVTLGVRMAEPLASNGFTPSFDPRRYLGVGPRLGFEGNKPLQSSWVVEWHVGAALLYGNRTFDSGGGVVTRLLPNFRQRRFGFQCRWIARPVVLVRHCVEVDARLSRRLFQRLDGVNVGTAADNATASIMGRWSGSAFRSEHERGVLFVHRRCFAPWRSLLLSLVGDRRRRKARAALRRRSRPRPQCAMNLAQRSAVQCGAVSIE